MTLNVIGAGFGRTGTDSMRHALNILGVGPTHHMFELGQDSLLREPWLELVNGAEPDWEILFEGYHASIDWPSSFYWRSLSAAYPEARVLLTMRSPESWWDSFEATILKIIQRDNDKTGFTQRLLVDQVFDGRPDDRDYAIDLYNRNVEEVISTIDSERLLVHNLGDGWAPLCRWLDLPIPNIDYPSRNSTKDFAQRNTAQD